MHEGEGSAREICNDSTGYVRRRENRVKHDPSGRRATPRIFPAPLPFHHDCGCVGQRDKGSMLCADYIVLCAIRREVVEMKRN